MGEKQMGKAIDSRNTVFTDFGPFSVFPEVPGCADSGLSFLFSLVSFQGKDSLELGFDLTLLWSPISFFSDLFDGFSVRWFFGL